MKNDRLDLTVKRKERVTDLISSWWISSTAIPTHILHTHTHREPHTWSFNVHKKGGGKSSEAVCT